MENRLGAGHGAGAARRKPAGGFCFISGTALLSAWWAYRRGFVTPLDLRVWLACFEAVVRRCGLPPGRPAHFAQRELRELVGNDSDEEIRRSLRRLSVRGLVAWSERSIGVGSPAQSHGEQETADLAAYLAQVCNHGRRVPVPRRVIRLLARTGTRVILATMFGHLLRCSYYRGHECRPTGTCKASWISHMFAVDIRNVKGARKALVEQGLLRFEPVGQRYLNHYGPLVSLNLDWTPAAQPQRRLPPRADRGSDHSPPLIRNLELLRNETNQNRTPACRSGAALAAEPGRVASRASLRHVVAADLIDRARLACLFQQACAAGYVQPTESDRLNFFAMAEHARAAGTRNVAGLFAANVRHRLWRVLTLADEDAARRRLSVQRARQSQRVAARQQSGQGTARPVAIGAVVGQVMERLGRNTGVRGNTQARR
jgi:hypothetical protein